MPENEFNNFPGMIVEYELEKVKQEMQLQICENCEYYNEDCGLCLNSTANKGRRNG